MRGTSWLSPKKKRIGWQRNVRTITNLKRKDMEREELAMKIAIRHGFDSVRKAGIRNGYEYFHIFSSMSVGQKTGMPQYVKISKQGTYAIVDNFSEKMWALKQEVSLNKLRDSH